MIKGLYTSASGMAPQLKKQETTANNIANAGTSGFKKDVLFTKELSKAEKKTTVNKSDWQNPMVDKIYVDYAPGAFDKTGNPLNMAIDGDGFFVLQLEDGSMALTRSGSFMVNNEGFISMTGGALLMSESGPLEVGNGQVTVAGTGRVEVDGSTIGKIVPMTVDDLEQLEKVGSSVFAVPDGVELIPVEKSSIQQGFLESSNVDIVREMIDMIISYRSYEANAKSAQIQDQTLDSLFNRVAGDR